MSGAASDVGTIVEALGIARFAVMGASGGGPHALACAALLPGRVTAAASVAGLAPLTDGGLDWFAGMAADGASLRSALRGPADRRRFEETADFDPTSFTVEDYAALEGPWSALGADVGEASADGPDGLIDDDLAYVRPWGFDVGDIRVPVLIVQGGRDRVVPPAHAYWLLGACRDGELWLRPNAGHISILDTCGLALDWLRAHSGDS